MPSAMRIQLASLGAITCLMRGTIGEIVAGPVGPSCRSMCSTSPRRVLPPAGQKPFEKKFLKEGRYDRARIFLYVFAVSPFCEEGVRRGPAHPRGLHLTRHWP